jgi:hypothetical protein
MKISLGWKLQAGAFGGGNQVGQALKAALLAAGHQVTHDLNDPQIDLILLADPRPELQITAFSHYEVTHYLRHINPNALLVHRINECDERKAQHNIVNPPLRQAACLADHVVFVSAWLRDLHLGQGMQARQNSVILNGSDTTLFHSIGHIPWDGHGPLKLVTHHWGASPLKGFDIYQRLDELVAQSQGRLSFTYIGRLPEGFRLQHSRYLEPLTGQALADELRAHHVYITASRFEPGSNHQNEGALCGLPLLYLQNGSLLEYCTGYGIGFTETDFEAQVALMERTYADWQPKMAGFPHRAERMVAEYLTLFSQLAEQRANLIAQRHWPNALTPLSKPGDSPLQWLQKRQSELPTFLESLQVAGQPGRFLPLKQRLTSEGQQIALPFSCLALKTYKLLGLWDSLPDSEQTDWIAFIQSFQIQGNPLGLRWADYAFIDPALVQPIEWQTRRWQRLKERWVTPWVFNRLQRALSAETKQAIATLAEVGHSSRWPYRGFPTTPRQLRTYLSQLDWARPWASGAHLATLAVFYRLEAPRWLPDESIEALLAICRAWVEGLVDEATGAYFRGGSPSYDERVNGAMKLLTALAWFEWPIHRPEALIDSTLSQLPKAEGCHLVDAAYVLQRCLTQTNHRKAEAQAYMRHLVGMMQAHYNPADGGFSYHAGRSQEFFHAVQIGYGYPCSDLHGTTLLTWASNLILNACDVDPQVPFITP